MLRGWHCLANEDGEGKPLCTPPPVAGPCALCQGPELLRTIVNSTGGTRAIGKTERLAVWCDPGAWLLHRIGVGKSLKMENASEKKELLYGTQQR